MNLPRYEFCKENKSHLLNFIKKANQCKSNPYCNITAYNNLSKVLPLSYILDKYPEETEIIDLIDSDEDQLTEVKSNNFLSQILQNTVEQPLNETVEVISTAIKDELETKKFSTSTVIFDLHKPNLDLVSIFKLLFEELSLKNMVDLGVLLSSHNITNDNIILAYVRHMLIKQLALEYSDQFQESLNVFCTKYPDILTKEISNFLLSSDDNYLRATLQFVDGLSIEFKHILLRDFILNCKHLEENHLALLNILLVDQTEIDTLNRLVELMSKQAESYSKNKVYGKCLLKVTQLLGRNISSLEKPMKHIIGNHCSIWKAKIQKTYDEFMQDDSLMSQSLRY